MMLMIIIIIKIIITIMIFIDTKQHEYFATDPSHKRKVRHVFEISGPKLDESI